MTVVAFPEPAPAARSETRRAKSRRETRRKVMDAARFLFLNVGYFDTTIRDVAQRAGMSTGAIFANVQDKAELWREACGGPAPSEKLAEEAALIMAAFPGWRWSLNAVFGGDFVASILTPDWKPIEPGRNDGRMFHGRATCPAEALRLARIEAERESGFTGATPWRGNG